MGSVNLPDVSGPFIELDDVNDLRSAFRGVVLGRNSSGSPASGQDLGSSSVPWGTLYLQNLNLNGQIIDFDNIGAGSTANSIISGATRTASGQPDFLRAAGSGGGASFDILATTTNLVYTASSVSATISADVTVSSLTVAPSTNNTCAINDTSYSGGNSTKYEGEATGSITIDAAGTEITSRVGQYVALKGTNEIMLAYVESTTELRNIYRGFFFDDSGDPIVRETLSDNDTLTFLSLGWIFAENNASTIDISYRSPYVQHDEPSAGVTDDYWLDLSTNRWKRYDGSDWQTIDRTLIGLCVIDTADCLATRALDFSKSFIDHIDVELEFKSTTQVRSQKGYSSISVYGSLIRYDGAPIVWDITTDLESGLTEASDTLYYVYISEDGEKIISDERPYNRVSDLRGFYHPYHTWRYVGVLYNNGSSNITTANSKNNNQKKVEVFTSSSEFLPLPNISNVKATVVGGGGGGGGAVNSSQTAGDTGGTSSFGSHCSATGGSGGETGNAAASDGSILGGDGGSGSGGDINLSGTPGMDGFTDSTTELGISGHGGHAPGLYGGSGANGIIAEADGTDATSPGGGGSGGFVALGGTGNSAGGGGGGGGCSIKFLSGISTRVSVTVGAGGAGKNTTRDGGDGADGIVVVEY